MSAVKAFVSLAFLFMFVSLTYATPNRVVTVGHCLESGKEVARIINALKAPPIGWNFVVTCHKTDWLTIRQRHDVVNTNTAFTVLDLRYTFLNGDLANGSNFLELRRVLNHELEHIRCWCDLGEKLHH